MVEYGLWLRASRSTGLSEPAIRLCSGGIARSRRATIPRRRRRSRVSGLAASTTTTPRAWPFSSETTSIVGYRVSRCPATSTVVCSASEPIPSAVQVRYRVRDTVFGAAGVPVCWSSGNESARATIRPESSATAKCMRRCGGTRSVSNSPAVTRIPVIAESSRASPVVSGSLRGVSRPSASSANRCAGDMLLRSCFGSDLTSAVASSARMPGTDQSKPAGRTWGSSACGITTVTPSSGAPGSNR